MPTSIIGTSASGPSPAKVGSFGILPQSLQLPVLTDIEQPWLSRLIQLLLLEPVLATALLVTVGMFCLIATDIKHSWC